LQPRREPQRAVRALRRARRDRDSPGEHRPEQRWLFKDFDALKETASGSKFFDLRIALSRESLLSVHQIVGASAKTALTHRSPKAFPFAKTNLARSIKSSLSFLVRAYTTLGLVRKSVFAAAPTDRESETGTSFQDDLDDSSAARAKRTDRLEPVGTSPTANSRLRNEFISERDGAAGQIARDGISSATGRSDRRRHRDRRIPPAPAHRAPRQYLAVRNSRPSRGQIAFGELGGAIGFRDVGVNHAKIEPLFREPRAMVRMRSTLSVGNCEARFVSSRSSFGNVGKPTFLVRLPEELRIPQTGRGAHFCPARSIPWSLLRIDDGQEMRGQLPAFLFHGEILLGGRHDRDQNLVRRLRKAGSKFPWSPSGIR